MHIVRFRLCCATSASAWHHMVILTAVIAAVACSVGTQYGVKYLVDSLSAGAARAGGVWLAFIFLHVADRGRQFAVADCQLDG